MTRWAGLVALLFAASLALSLGGEANQAGADLRNLASRPAPAAAWSAPGQAGLERFITYCRRVIPPDGVVVSIAARPASGYYRMAYLLYPRTLWPYVSPLGAEADRPHALSAARLRSVLAATGARYLAVWHVALPPSLPGGRRVAVFASGEYVVVLR